MRAADGAAIGGPPASLAASLAMTSPVRLEAADGRSLGGALTVPAGDAPRTAVLVASAMGVPHRFYGSFCEFLAAGGCAVLRFDYRGVGESRAGPVRREPARLHEWGELDVAAAVEWLAARFPGAPLALVGHSAGGWLPALAPNRGRLAAMATVASQSAWWGLWPWPSRAWMLLFWQVVLPLAVTTFGHLPRWLLGSEPIPRGVAREWAAWARRRDFLASYPKAPKAPKAELSGNPSSGFDGEFDGPLRAYAIAGDLYAPPTAVRELPRLYPQARAEVQVFATPGRNGEPPGHFNVFRDSFREALWAPLRDWLIDQVEAAGARAGPTVDQIEAPAPRLTR